MANQNVLQLTQQSTTDPTSVFYAVTGGTTDTGLPLSVLSSYLIKAYPGFLQTETGAVARSVQAKLQDMVSVIDFGADPTGAADSTIAIQNAINSGDLVFIPEGTYLVTSTITIAAGTTIKGAGQGITTITTNNATVDILKITAAQVSIGNLGFTSSVTRTAGAFVNFTSSSSQVLLRDFYMTNHYIGVHMTAASSGRVQFGYIFGGATTTGSTAILVDGGNDVYLNQLTIDAPNAQQPNSGIQVTQTGALNITDCDVIHHSNNLLINPGNGQSVASLWVINSYFDTAVRGILINPSGTGQVIRSRFTSTWSSSHSQQGILIKADGTSLIDGIEFIGHHAFLNALAGGFVQASTGTTRNIRFTAGAFCQNSGQGLFFDAGISEFSVVGVRVGSGFGNTPGNAGGGIIIASGASNNYTITDNDVRGNTGSAISDGGTGTTKIITGNLGYNLTTGTGVTQVFNTAPTFTGTVNFGSGAAATDISITNTGTNGASIQMTGNGATTPQKTIRVLSGALQVVNSAFSAVPLVLTDAGALTVTGSVTPSTTGGIVGTTLADNANAGSVGEVITSSVAGSSVSLTSGTSANITSISLTAGDWDVWGAIDFVPAGTTTVSQLIGSINTVSATLGGVGALSRFTLAFTTGALQDIPVPDQRINVSTTTTVYLVANAAFGTSTMTAGGAITARRRR